MYIDDEWKEQIFDYIKRFKEKGEYNVLEVPAFLEADFELDHWTARKLLIEFIKSPNMGEKNGS
jgi:hypothetical protein